MYPSIGLGSQQVQPLDEGERIDRFFGVGKVTATRLRELHILTGADLKRLSEEQLRALFHDRGSLLYRYVRGDDSRPVQPARERKSIGKEVTLPEDIVDRGKMEGILERLADQVGQRMTEVGMLGKMITLKVRWSDFQLITRSSSLWFQEGTCAAGCSFPSAFLDEATDVVYYQADEERLLRTKRPRWQLKSQS